MRRTVARTTSGYAEIRRYLQDGLEGSTAQGMDDVASAAAAIAEAFSDSGLGEMRLIVTLRGDHIEVEVRSAQRGGQGKVAPDAGSFAAWLVTHLDGRHLSHEAAARLIGVSVKTVSRWTRSETEPRMRDLRRLHEVFGDAPPLDMRSAAPS